jgi:hypothetical protein
VWQRVGRRDGCRERKRALLGLEARGRKWHKC